MNLIIGSGLIGMIAKHMLGDQWDYITQKRSRFYSFTPVLANNYIVVSDAASEFMDAIGSQTPPLIYKSAFSYNGQLFDDPIHEIVDPYLHKVYGDNNIPDIVVKTNSMVYGTTCKQLHDMLSANQKNLIKQSLSEVISIDIKNHELMYRKPKKKPEIIEYDKIINTVPLNIFTEWCGQTANVEARHVCYYHIRSSKVDIEGNDECLICDNVISFFKCVNLGNDEYVFWTFDDIDNPHDYFGKILGYDLDIIDVFRVADAIPVGDAPDLSELEKNGIFCVGSNAQWNDLIGVGTCIKKIKRIMTL